MTIEFVSDGVGKIKYYSEFDTASDLLDAVCLGYRIFITPTDVPYSIGGGFRNEIKIEVGQYLFDRETNTMWRVVK